MMRRRAYPAGYIDDDRRPHRRLLPRRSRRDARVSGETRRPQRPKRSRSESKTRDRDRGARRRCDHRLVLAATRRLGRPLHRLRRGRGARAAERGGAAACSTVAFARGRPRVPAGATGRADRCRGDRRPSWPRSSAGAGACSTRRSRARSEQVDARRAHLDPRRGAARARSCAGAQAEPRLAARTYRAQPSWDAGRAQSAQRSTMLAPSRDRTRSPASIARATSSPRAQARGGRDRRRAAVSSPSCSEQRTLAERQLGELEVQRAKHEIRAPATSRPSCRPSCSGPASSRSPGPRVLAVLDPRDKYVQIYVPVGGPRTESASDAGSRSSSTATPGGASPGRSVFVADQANFTPEKIETRERPRRPGVPRQGAHPRGRRALPARALKGTSTCSTTTRRVRATRRSQRAAADDDGQERPRARWRSAFAGSRSASARARALAGVELSRSTGAQLVGVVGPDGAGQDDPAPRAGGPARGRGRATRRCSASICAATCGALKARARATCRRSSACSASSRCGRTWPSPAACIASPARRSRRAAGELLERTGLGAVRATGRRGRSRAA